MSSLLLILTGALLIWLSATGRLAAFLATIFAPQKVAVQSG
ncbi:hypothetical protein [Alicyclobacillus kakegawensis]|nr:hypothetical protein [Alicyclobacillus kakegawensis]